MKPREGHQGAEILPFPLKARLACVAASRSQRLSQPLPGFVEFAAGGAAYHEDAIREDAEKHGRRH
ncbi:DUF2735 domain-containing protein [Jiella sp. MQZ9-1]|uniref:DUF2735 domain-containing protein n=1 Tax=Jiella flava TaxID=2816857 RepID=A0A939FTA4_9HYPH|nr:DUF2735 domain-containing protein [Jiella flava]MBO0661538.1 DUF2735 domain-containing protein [Jiella flava]MCD2470180.1 DUF2735 domain-containing protein [Jiella flava]